MPTGYTSIIEDNETVSFRDYALRCARAFSACIHQRDESMDRPPRYREIGSYYAKALARTRSSLDRVLSMTAAAAENQAALVHQEDLAGYHGAEQRRKKMIDRYNRIRSEVESWEPPTNDHVALKTFMLDQIDETIRVEYGSSLPMPKRLTGAEWREKCIENLRQSIEFYETKQDADQQRAQKANAWIDALLESLPE